MHIDPYLAPCILTATGLRRARNLCIPVTRCTGQSRDLCRSRLNMRRQGTCVRHAHIANCVTQGRRKLLHTTPWKRTASAIPGLPISGTFRSLPQVLGGRLIDGRLYTAAGLWVQAVAELVWQLQADALSDGQMGCMLSAACRWLWSRAKAGCV